MSNSQAGWEPDPRKVGNWTKMFEDKARADAPPPPVPTEPADAYDDIELAIDPTEYRPWTLQRGRTPAALLLALRWFDGKAGHWHGAAVAYPSLYAIDTIGDRMVSLDFGTRQFVIEGNGLGELARHLQQGSVVAVHEYAASVWSRPGAGGIVTSIRSVGAPP